MNRDKVSAQLEELAQSPNVPLKVRKTCKSMAERMTKPLCIAVVGAAQQRLIQYLSPEQAVEPGRLISSSADPNNPIEETFDFDVLGQEIDVPKFLNLIPKRDWVLVIWLPGTDELSQLEHWNKQEGIALERCILWHDGAEGQHALDSFGLTSSDGKEVMSWLARCAQSGRDADLATSLMIIRKYENLLQHAPRAVDETAELDTLAIIANWARNMAMNESGNILFSCLTLVENLIENSMSLPPNIRKEIETVQDQIVLLELEGTDHATNTALAIILQLREEIERTIRSETRTNLPNINRLERV